jgi:hypothetical protein
MAAESGANLLRCKYRLLALVRHRKNADRRPLSGKPDTGADIAE